MWKNLEIKKGTALALKFYQNGDITLDKLIFACKETKTPSANADILKKNTVNSGSDTEIFVSYDNIKKQSLIKVFLVPSDTIDLTNVRYYYSLKNETTNEEYYVGKLYLIQSIYGSSTNYIASIRYHIGTTLDRQALALTLASSDEGFVWFYDTDDDSLYLWNGASWV